MSKAAAKRAFESQRDQYVKEVAGAALKDEMPLWRVIEASHADSIPADMRLFVYDRAYDQVEAAVINQSTTGTVKGK